MVVVVVVVEVLIVEARHAVEVVCKMIVATESGEGRLEAAVGSFVAEDGAEEGVFVEAGVAVPLPLLLHVPPEVAPEPDADRH